MMMMTVTTTTMMITDAAAAVADDDDDKRPAVRSIVVKHPQWQQCLHLFNATFSPAVRIS